VSSVEATELEKQDVKSVVLVVEESDDEEGRKEERWVVGILVEEVFIDVLLHEHP
jgi:hypothetical protein